MRMKELINFKLNGKPVSLSVDGEKMLLWVLRSDLGLTGTKYGCGEGFCGACTVLINNEAVRSCQLPLKKVKGKEILTIEGLASGDKLHPLQEAFIAHEALQCGFCTPGMILNALSLLRRNQAPTSEEIIEQMDNNLCRCGSHKRIVAAIQAAASMMKGRKLR